MKKFLLIGNGFTIDFLSHLKISEDVDVINLFKNGEDLAWPENNSLGFLSYKYCPNLWNLGIRPYNDKNHNYEIFEDIITCANMSNDVGKINIEDKIYLKAYKELINYLKFLFISYNKDFQFEEDKIKEWGWYKFLKKLKDDDKIEEVIIVTLNYDIFLEQILQTIGIEFNILGFTNENIHKFNIIKPHGSISFRHKQEMDIDSFRIKYELESLESELNDFQIDYDLDYTQKIPLINALLPPAGDSSRFSLTWANDLKKMVIDKAKEITENDDLIICGVSYWHVDRQEVDKYLTNMNSNVNVYLINPYPSNVFNAVLTTIFKNVILYKKSDNLGK